MTLIMDIFIFQWQLKNIYVNEFCLAIKCESIIATIIRGIVMMISVLIIFHNLVNIKVNIRLISGILSPS